MTIIRCCFWLKCGLPSLDECKALAEEALSDGDLFSAVKFHLLSAEPADGLRIGIDFVKGTRRTDMRRSEAVSVLKLRLSCSC